MIFKQLAPSVFIVFSLLIAALPARAEEAYSLNPGDILKILVWNEEQLITETIIRPDGFISMPLAGNIKAGGLTVNQLEQSLATALGKYLKDAPSVTVNPIRLDGNKISVIGKVNRPGEYLINRPTDVMGALALGSGLNQFAAENSIKILRRNENGEQKAIPFRYGDVKSGEELETNILLKAGDIVVVP
jgi:polysaccharide export outer membrane protein